MMLLLTRMVDILLGVLIAKDCFCRDILIATELKFIHGKIFPKSDLPLSSRIPCPGSPKLCCFL